MAEIKDKYGNDLVFVDRIGGETIADPRTLTVNLTNNGAETVLMCANTNSAAIDVRGVFSATLLAEYSIDGAVYSSMPIYNTQTEIHVAGITSVGSFVGHLPSGTTLVRVKISAYTSGTAIVALKGSHGDNFIITKPIPTTSIVTVTAAAAAAATCTLPSAGTGLFHYIKKIVIERFCAATLTAAATPVIVTTTNINGSLAFSFPADAGAQGTIVTKELDFNSNPLKSTAAATATTIVCPATPNVIWRVTTFYYIGQ